jgi:hypothetical protein
MNKKIILSLLILASLCACGSIAVFAGFFFVAPPRQIAGFSPTEAAPALSNPDTTDQIPQPLDTPIPDSHSSPNARPLPAELTGQMDEIQQQVIAIRGLQAKNPISRNLLTTSELQQKVEKDFFKDYTTQDAKNDELLLSTLGMIPEGFDLMDLYHRLYAEQVAGYYDSDTKQMYVVEGKGFGGIERMTYAHEYTHTLQDQNYDMQNGLKMDEKYCKTENEYCSAVTALLEGDATYTEEQWLTEDSNQQDKQDVQAFYGNYASPVFDSAPEYLQSDFLFPYQKGLEFVYSLNDRGGYKLVDQAFKNPPSSTEQILHPDKYPSEKPVDVTLPDLGKILPQGWNQVSNNELGEWYTYLVLSKGLDAKYQLLDSIAKKASAGWGGDRYAVYTDPRSGKVVFLLHTKWDTRNDADEFFRALKEYGQERWGNASQTTEKSLEWTTVKEGQATFKQSGQDTLWLISPDPDIQASILAALPEFQ